MKCPYVMKRCSKCGEIKHISKFYKMKNNKYGVRPDCKECHNKYKKKYNNDNKDKIKKCQKEYNKTHKKERKVYNQKYYKEHKDTINKNCIKYQNNNKEKIRISRKKYREDNPEKFFNYGTERRSKEEIQGDGITKEQWIEMMNFFGWTCAYSDEYIGGDNNKNIRTIDHIIALDNGGEHEIWNCIPMVRKYNSSKKNKDMLEWYLKQPFFSIERLTKIYEWRIYAYEKWGKEMV